MLLKLLIDFGLVVLIWMTQLIVYPGFTYYSELELASWHAKYTTAISVIVMPLMLLQVGIHGLQLILDFNPAKLLASVLIVLVWVNTFFFAVPLHNQIGVGLEVLAAAHDLVKINWYRAILWTLVFFIGVYDFLKN